MGCRTSVARHITHVDTKTYGHMTDCGPGFALREHPLNVHT
jgi:hypothetical protein